MSLGSDVSDPDAECILAYQRAAQQLIDNGCIVVAAAGNAGRRTNHWVGQPARCQGYMAVAAVDKNEKLADFSSNGPDTLCPECGVEIAAPGVSINSTWNDGKYKAISGTSMACPHVSGAAALLKEQHPTWDPARIRATLKSTARDLGAPGNDPMFGAGLLDCHKAVFG
jgi:subtilisin family serine protease